jgi:hypothetical protein
MEKQYTEDCEDRREGRQMNRQRLCRRDKTGEANCQLETGSDCWPPQPIKKSDYEYRKRKHKRKRL